MGPKGLGRAALAVLLGVAAAICSPRVVRGQDDVARGSAQEACTDKEWAAGDLGIERSECTCALTYGPGTTALWRFDSELTIRRLRDGGPAEGKLRPGDRVVAIDGLLITTPEGGRRWSNIQPGETVRLLVRRGRRTVTVEITAGARCEPQLGLVSRRADTGEHPGTADSVLLVRSFTNLLLRVWFGFVVTCDDCMVWGGETGTDRLWRFTASPEIRGLIKDGPADRAGLEVGDVLTAIDGLPLTEEAGARRFSSVRPGETVRLTVQRGEERLTVRIVPVRRRPPASVEAFSLGALMHRIEQLPELPNSEAVGEHIRELLQLLRGLADTGRVPPE